MGILQVLRFEFQKFRILEILKFHPCIKVYKQMRKRMAFVVNGGKRVKHWSEVNVEPSHISELVVKVTDI